MNDERSRPGRGNLVLGWSALVLFIALGLGLEGLHLFKSPSYFEVAIRRELWTLAHAHGGLLALLNVVFALVAGQLGWSGPAAIWSGRLLAAALVLVPAGFFLGGIGNSESDPSLWIVLTPVGAVAALTGLCLALPAVWRGRR